MDYKLGQIRLFTAVALPDDVKKKTAEITRGKLPVPYINTDNLHITLSFFGELDTDKEELVKKIFKEICSGKPAFEIVFGKIVAHHNRQIHLTVKPNASLLSLQKELEQEFRKHGFIFSDRAYYPHVKLANMHMDNVMNRERKITSFPNEELQQLNFTAKKLVLYASKLLLHHAHHTPLIEVELI